MAGHNYQHDDLHDQTQIVGYFSHEFIQSQNQTTTFAIYWITMGLGPIQYVSRG